MKIPRLFLLIVFITDMVAFNGAWWGYYYVRQSFSQASFTVKPELLWLPTLVMTLFWVLIFFVSGLYQLKTIVSRFDELLQIIKSTLVGTLIISFMIFLDESRLSVIADVRLIIFIYWFLLTFLVVMFRLTIRTFQRKLLINGILARNTIVIGDGKKSEKVRNDIYQSPALGFRFIGFVRLSPEQNEKSLGSMDELENIVNNYHVEEIILALETADQAIVTRALKLANPPKINVKIIPDLYDVVSGQARTNQIYGFPLINLNPHYFTPTQQFFKRTTDIILSVLILFFTLPITILTAIFIKFESAGPIFFKQERVGLNGLQFYILKFRSMIQNAETKTGPTWAQKDDPRITRVGKLIRKYRIDEIPQLINVLKGEMSVIGPRPERQFFIDQLKQDIPFYERRLKVKPGITGLAQVKHKYDEAMEDVVEKVKYDLYYIENMSIRMDITIIYHTILTLIRGKGQ